MILIVDDKQENLLSLRKILELNAYDVDTALSGEEALRKILKNEYYLVILDVQMPGMDGFEVAEAITGLNRTKNLPILFLSAVNTHKKFVTKGFESGGVDYLTKPVDTDILILKVRTFYSLYQQSRQLAEAHNTLQQEVEHRKRTERSLLETVQQMHSTLESLPQIAFTARFDGTVDFANQHWYRYAPAKEEFPQTAPGQPTIRELWNPDLVREQPFTAEVLIMQTDLQTYHHFLLRIIPVFVKNKLIKWVGTFTNIDDQKLMHELLEQKIAERTTELVNTNRELEASNNDLQQFASVASHDLKEPLRKIRTFSSIITQKFSVDDSLRLYLEKINQSTSRMNMLIEDLLHYSKLSSPSVFEFKDLNNIVTEVLSDLELTILEKQVKVNRRKLPHMDVYPGLIRQLFQNLLSNAFKFSRPGITPEILITGEFTTGLSFDSPTVAEGNFCRLTVSDNGIGFNPQYAEKIFTMFQRLHSKEVYEGTGIGLTIVKKIVEKHNGIIRAQSEDDQGAAFIMVFPVKQQK